MVMEVVHEDMGGEGSSSSTQCTNHPYKHNSSPGGICALCLQEKLGKLVSSSFPIAIFPSSSSSPSPSFRSDFNLTTTNNNNTHFSSNLQISTNNTPFTNNNNKGYYNTRKSSRLPFVRKKKKDVISNGGGSDNSSIVFKRSKSIATPRRGMHFLDENENYNNTINRRGFWSFLRYPTISSNNTITTKKSDKNVNFTPTTPSTVLCSKKREDFVVVDENGSPDEAAIDRKVSRSRSVGCGSRSFSGDFFERISTGFGDCTLRRVESQREGKSKVQPPSSVHRNNAHERVRCGGIFSGFMINSSSSSSSSSNSYWVSNSEENNNNVASSNNSNNKSICGGNSTLRNVSHGRSKSWGWALASPMRAFSKPSSSTKRDNNINSGSNKNVVTPNLAAIPSLLAVSG